MKKIKKLLALVLAVMMVLVPQTALAAETPGETSARYIKAIINKIAEDYRFRADKEAMYEAVLDYVMNENPELLEGAIKAVTDTLDDYSEYFTAEELATFFDYIEQAYVGIGVTIQETDNGILVLEVNPNGGAFDAGMQLNDIIIEVEGQNIVGMGSDVVSGMIRGEEGTTVNLKVKRGEQEISLTIERRRILTETVGYTIEEGGVGYLYISQFSSTTPESVQKALEEFRMRGIRKMIIDVRDNPGGELASALGVLDLFVPKGKVLTKLCYNNSRYDKELKSEASFVKKPDRKILILTNENSASASELFAGAMQYHGLAKTVGVRTFGKGSMQQFMGLLSPNGIRLGDIKLSVAEFTLPNGGKINGEGISPNVRVKNYFEPYDASQLTPMTLGAKYSVGSEASDVLAIEERLEVLGYYPGKVDGVFDTFTASATEVFQADRGLYVYGVMDYTTQNALIEEISEFEIEIDNQFDTAYNMLLKE